MSFDIFVERYKIAIEYDGEQHFIPIKAWGGESTLEKIIDRDIKKDELVKNNPEDVKYMLRIGFNDKNNISNNWLLDILRSKRIPISSNGAT